MTHKQHPIGIGFTAAATADDVLAGIDLTGKNVVVTGGYAGIGLKVTRALNEAGASVTATSRNPTNIAPSQAGIERMQIERLDLVIPPRSTTSSSDGLRPGARSTSWSTEPGHRVGRSGMRVATRRSSRPTIWAISS